MPLATEGFGTDLAQSDQLAFPTGVVGQGLAPLGTPTNRVQGGVWEIRIYNPGGANGYAVVEILLPYPTTAVGFDAASISSSRGVAVAGRWDSPDLISIDLWTLFGSAANGFFGVVASEPFDSFQLYAPSGSVVGDDLFSVDNLSFALPNLVFADGFEG
jgi:hypothetical protein